MNETKVILIVLLGFSGLDCRREEPLPPEAKAPSPERTSAGEIRLPGSSCETVGIKVEKAEVRECRSLLKAMGKVIAPPCQTAYISHMHPCQVSQVHVRVGDWVKVGQPVITLVCTEVGNAKCEFYKATANAELAKLNLVREERLAAGGIEAKKNHLAAETDHKVAQANLEAAEKRLHILGFTEEQVKEIAGTHEISAAITLNSPIGGKVVASNAILGALVDPTKEILTVMDPKILWIDAAIYEKDVAKVQVGQKVEIRVPAYPDLVFGGKIGHVGDLLDSETRTITVRTEVANEDYRLKPGMFADVGILYNGSYPMLVVPSCAVLDDGGRSIVFVKDKDRFLRREVKVGVSDGDRREILEGLAAGEEVVTEGNHELKSKLQEEVLRSAHH